MIQPSQLSRWIYEYQDIWQWDLLNPSKLVSFIKDRNVVFWEDHIIHLWQLGWVRAEIIQGNLGAEIEGIDIIENLDDEESLFADNRSLGLAQVHVKEPARELVEKIPGVVPFFHPFKYFVFWEIQMVMRLRTHPYQMLIPGRYHESLDHDIEFFYRWAQGENTKAQINRWDEISRLAIATEPCFYPHIIGSLKYHPPITAEQQKANILAYKTQLKDHYLQIGIEPINEIIKELCISAEMMEPNKNLHSLMRFMNGTKRLKIKGHLGGAILMKFMAETIRRMTEWSFDIQLPEEDEMGFGMWVEGARERIYGSKRIFETQDLLAKRQIIREMGLDAEVRIRIYVEGSTEYAAFSYLLKHLHQIQIIDLAGQFIQGKKNGLAFQENLIQDDHSGVFSVIILDGDREDNIRIVRTAAEDDLFCGQFYISQPDFEFCNYSIDELTEIVWEFVDEIEKSEQLYQLLHEAINKATNANELIKAASKTIPSLSQLAKGNEWGEKLAEFAARKPELDGSEIDRPFIEACKTAIQSIDIDYHINRTEYRVDPCTGKLVHRKK